MFLSNVINTFIYDHTLHRGRKHFFRHSLQAFRAKEILERHFKDCFKVKGKQRTIMLKKGENLESKNHERKMCDHL